MELATRTLQKRTESCYFLKLTKGNELQQPWHVRVGKNKLQQPWHVRVGKNKLQQPWHVRVGKNKLQQPWHVRVGKSLTLIAMSATSTSGIHHLASPSAPGLMVGCSCHSGLPSFIQWLVSVMFMKTPNSLYGTCGHHNSPSARLIIQTGRTLQPKGGESVSAASDSIYPKWDWVWMPRWDSPTRNIQEMLQV